MSIYDIKKLAPGNIGKDCVFNGEHYDEKGNIIPICCDESDYLMCCIEEEKDCYSCSVVSCPNKKRDA